MTSLPDFPSQIPGPNGESSEADSIDLSTYAAELRGAARRLDASGPESWRAVVDRGLAEAYRQRNPAGLASMIQLIVGFLDAEGRVVEALSEIEHAIARSKSDPPTLAILEALRAAFLCASGDVGAATEAIASSELAQSRTTLPFALGRSMRLCAGVGMTTLTNEDLAPVEALMEISAAGDSESTVLHLMSIYVPYRFVLGEHIDARPWNRGLRLAAEAAHHTYRVADAATFERAEAAILELKTPSTSDLPTWNWIALWRVHALRLYLSLLRREAERAQKELAALLRARHRAGSANLDGIDAFQANVAATIAAPDQQVTVARPASVHLLNMGSTLAGAEAVAIAGSRSEAATWHDWLTSEVPARVQTAIEWPVSRLRIEALLSLRAGDLRSARHELEDAMDWAGQASYPIERALAQVQFAEFLDQHGTSAAGKTIRALRDEGWKWLRSAGVDPAPHAYIVAHRTAVGRAGPPLSPLTRRETDTLVLLAEGLSYKEIADRLGIRWPTVQALAHRCYAKLAASGRLGAIQAARDLGIL